MKKLFISLSLMSLVLTGTVSCSSDDNNKEKNQLKTLVLTASSTTIDVNGEVTFMASVGQEAVNDIQIYVNGNLASNPFTFETAGDFKVVAKKEGYLDSNELTIKVNQADKPIIGSWVPTNVNVQIPMSDPIEMPYPGQENCDEDTLTFSNDNKVSFAIHDENCAISTTGTTWSYNESTKKLTFTLFDQQMVVSVVTNTANSLVIKAKGDQFAALIPILAPDLANDLPPALLALVEVQLEFKK